MNNQIKNEIEKLQQVIKDAQDMIEKLSNKNNEEIKKVTGWERVENNYRYYSIENNEVFEMIEWSLDTDNKLYNTANYFSNKELAERIAFEQTLFRKLKKFADENNEKDINWNDENQEKYYIEYNYSSNDIEIESYSHYSPFGTILFTSIEVTKKAIETFKDELLEYFGDK